MRIKHRLNRNSIKMYDKQGSVLRVETTINDARDIKVYRTKEGKSQGGKSWRRKGIADLHRRAQVSQAANERYLASIAAVEDTTALGDLASQLCQPAQMDGRRVRALNPFSLEDARLLGGGQPRRICHPWFPQPRLAALAVWIGRGVQGRDTPAGIVYHAQTTLVARPWLNPEGVENASLHAYRPQTIGHRRPLGRAAGQH
jgi:hypothetical protein